MALPRQAEKMADIFVSYTSSDRDWAYWIGRELEALGHVAHIHEWELKSGEDIYEWMEQRHDAADHVLCVLSDDYLKAPYSKLERNAAIWQAAGKRPGFVLFVAVKPCKLPTLADHFRRCELFNVDEAEARRRFRDFMSARNAAATIAFPGELAVSNIPIRVPEHFVGREDSLGSIRTALTRYEGRVAITALHGLRGVGKTTLAAAYAERHGGDYRATWWIRAETEATMRADLVGLGARLNWVDAEAKEDVALQAVMERLRQEGDGLLLVYDNAIDARSLKPYLPTGGRAHVLLTSNAHAWRGLASPVEIRLWPRQIGADYLIARTGRESERATAEALSETLGGLPLAHEQAAAYCERLDISLADYARRFSASPAKFLDTESDAPLEYHDGLTVAKTFALAIEEAAKLNPAAEPLIVHLALLAPEAVPLFVFSEGREALGRSLASALADEGLDEAIAALRAFALVDREEIVDERDPEISTACVRLHRLVRQVAAIRRTSEEQTAIRQALAAALESIYPEAALVDPAHWPKARRLDAIALDLTDLEPDTATVSLLAYLAGYRQSALGRFTEADALYERTRAGSERVFGPESAETSTVLHNHAYMHEFSGEVAKARRLYEQALAIREKVLGEQDERTANTLNNLARMIREMGELDVAKPLFERALAIHEKRDPSSVSYIVSLRDLAQLYFKQDDYVSARALYEQALAIGERAIGPESYLMPYVLTSYGHLLHALGENAEAERVYRRALAIDVKHYGGDHPRTAKSHAILGRHLLRIGDAGGALVELEQALADQLAAIGAAHEETLITAALAAAALDRLGRADEAAAIRAKYNVENHKL